MRYREVKKRIVKSAFLYLKFLAPKGQKFKKRKELCSYRTEALLRCSFFL